MDVDTPNILKRCSSAPLINEVVPTAAISPTTTTAPRSSSFLSMFSNNLRTRRHSGSFSPLAAPHAANSWGPRAARVHQLRLEECADVSNTREVAHEREVHCAMQLGQSCEDLSLPGLAGSPTRLARFPPVVSPSPTRKYTTRRSLSPIAIRASRFSPEAGARGKRRGDDAPAPRPKRACREPAPAPPGPAAPEDHELECTFRPVSPRDLRPAHAAQDAPHASHVRARADPS